MGIVPNFDNELYHDIAASVALVSIAMIFRCSGRVGLKWPDSRNGWGPLAVLICYTTTYNLVGGFSVSHLTFYLVFFEILTEGLTGLWEEPCFRGFLMTILRPCGLLGSLLISSALFGILHVNPANEFIQYGRFLITASLGLMFAVNRLQTNSILPAAITHGANNSLNDLFSTPSEAVDGGISMVNQEWFMAGISVTILIYCFATIRGNFNDWNKRFGVTSPAC